MQAMVSTAENGSSDTDTGVSDFYRDIDLINSEVIFYAVADAPCEWTFYTESLTTY